MFHAPIMREIVACKCINDSILNFNVNGIWIKFGQFFSCDLFQPSSRELFKC